MTGIVATSRFAEIIKQMSRVFTFIVQLITKTVLIGTGLSRRRRRKIRLPRPAPAGDHSKCDHLGGPDLSAWARSGFWLLGVWWV